MHWVVVLAGVLSNGIRYPMFHLKSSIGIIVSGLTPVYGRIAIYLNPPYIGLHRSQYVAEEPHCQDNDCHAHDLCNGLDGRC